MNLLHRIGRGAAVAAAGWLALLPGTAAAAPPQLSIAVDNDHRDVRTGDVLEYTVTIRNLGTSDVTALRVTQSTAPGLEVKSSAPAGRQSTEGLTWKLNVKASGTATVHSTMTVVDAPDDTTRVATVACARTAADAPPIVCATHSAGLPAHARRAAASTSDTKVPRWWWYTGGGAAALLVVAVVAFVLIRRRARRQAATQE